MAFKFPFTNYHELNLTWVLEQLKKLFEDSEENVETIEGYEDRLSAVEDELPVVEATADQAAQTANAAATLAQTAKSTADTANENALAASAQAGLARQEAAAAEAEAQAATQAAQQAQATVQNFDGRITQAENDASEALQEAQSFENRVDAAINTANNAANTATIAQGIAVNANQNAATALDTAQTADGKAEAAQDAAQVADGKAEAAQEAAEQAAQDVIDKAPVIINSASGEIASFNDGADAMPVKSLVASIEPVQDLHGYDAPWPGGGGKNKLPPPTQNSQTTSGVTFVKNNDGSITLSGTATVNAAIVFVSFDLPAGDYILSNVGSNAAVSGGEATVYVRDTTNNATLTSFELGDSVSGFLFTLSANINIRFYAVVQSGVTVSGTLYPMIRNSGDGDNTYAPYFNECPISGHTGMTVARTGVNVWDEEWELGSLTASGALYPSTTRFRCKNYIPIKPNTGYYVKSYDNQYLDIHFYDADKNHISYSQKRDTVVTSPANAAYMKFCNSEGTTYGNNISINYPSTDTAYHAYTGTTIPITWQTEAGTVYGGSLTIYEDGSVDLVVIDGYITSYNGETLSDNYISSEAAPNTTPVTGSQVFDFGASTEIYHLNNISQITTFLGVNNIWTDCGLITVEYRANTKLYIDGKFTDTKMYIDGKVAELQALILEN